MISETNSGNELRLRSEIRRRAAKRWVIGVASASVLLLATLLTIGLQMTDRVNPTAPTRADAVPKQAIAVASTPVDDQQPVTSESQQQPSSPAPAAPVAVPTDQVTNTSDACNAIAATYAGLVSKLALPKPNPNSRVSALGSLTYTLLRNQYNALATAYNTALTQYHADYDAKTAALSCQSQASPFAGTGMAQLFTS